MSSEMDVSYEFHPDGKMADLTLIIGDHKILISKTVLGLASPVFCAMFGEDFQEKNQNEIPLPGKKYEDFMEFLRCIYPDKTKKVKEKNVYMLLPLAHEYDVEKMLKRCQKVLFSIVTNEHSGDVVQLYHHIKMSETYNLEELKEKCIYLASEHTLKEFKDAHAEHQITETSHYRIIELALRRRELDKADEKHIFSVSAKTVNYGTEVGVTLEGRFKIKYESDVRRNMRALRLIERYNISIDGTDVRSTILKNLKHKIVAQENMEEFDLLPEKVKDELQDIK